MHGGVEILDAVRGVRQFGDAEQGGLEPLAPLALEHLLAQHAVGLTQRGGARGDPAFQFLVGLTAFERRLHVLGHIGEQLAVVRRVAGVVAVALHHQGADHLFAVLHGHAEPVVAGRTDGDAGAWEVAFEVAAGAHQGATALQHVPGEAVLDLLDRADRFRVRRIVVEGVDEVGETHRAALRVVQHDEEVLGVHEAADDAVQRRHHVAHVVLGARLLGDGVERPLESLGQGQAGDRLVEVGRLGQLAQAGPGQAAQPADHVGPGGGILFRRGQEQGAPGLRVVAEFKKGLAAGRLGGVVVPGHQGARQQAVGEGLAFATDDFGVGRPEQALHGVVQRLDFAGTGRLQSVALGWSDGHRLT